MIDIYGRYVKMEDIDKKDYVTEQLKLFVQYIQNRCPPKANQSIIFGLNRKPNKDGYASFYLCCYDKNDENEFNDTLKLVIDES